MAKAFINDTNLTDIADAIRATLDESRQYLPSEMAAAIQSVPVMAQLNRKKYFQPVPAGAASGYATIEQIEGNTVAWNQMVNQSDSSSTAYGVTKTISNNVITLSGTYDSTFPSQGYYAGGSIPNNVIIGHVYYLALNIITWTVMDGDLKILIRGLPAAAAVNNTTPASISTANDSFGNIRFYSAAGTQVNVQFRLLLHDLTAIFGAGNEPTTVADFEAWLAQNGLPSVADYNAGELLSVKMNGMQTEDSSQQTLDTIALDVTTITGINTATNVRETIFPQGMKKADRAGTVKDELDLLSDTATVNVGSRAYQSGDESDTDVLTDGTTTNYALNTPIEYTDLQDANGNPLNPRYKVERGGTEQVLPANTSTPTTVAPTLSTIYKKSN